MLEARKTEAFPVASGFKLHNLRWWIVGLVFLATLINYIDRLTISVLAPVITRDLGLTNTQFGGIVTWFLLAYTISQGLSGKLYDRIGTRLGFVLSVTVWSVAAIAHAFARGLGSLSLFRFVLGLGEAGNWPGAAKTVAEWFPIRERAFGMAIFNSGAAIGSIVAPPLIVWLQLRYGWQTTFIVTGILGFFWLALWLLFYQSPERHRWITPEELRLIREGKEAEGRGEGETRGHGDAETRGRGDAETRGHGDTEKRGHGEAETGRYGEAETGRYGEAETGRYGDAETGRYGDAEIRGRGDAEIRGRGDAARRGFLRVPVSPRPRVSSARPRVSSSLRWRDLLRYRQVWAVVLARFLTDPVWWLYITWLPKYLADARGFSLTKIGLFAWVPYVAADAGSLSGGWLSGHLIARGWSVDRARKTVILFAACLMPAGILAAFVNEPLLALGLIGVVLFGFQVWINNVQTLPSDFFPDQAVASVAGLGGTGAGIGSMIFIFATGWVVDHFSYVPVLVAAGLLAPIGTVVLFTLTGKIRKLRDCGNAELRNLKRREI